MLVKQRKEDAWKIVSRLHQVGDGTNDMFAREEFYQMSQQVEADRILSEQETVMDLFRKPSYRKRMICGGLTMFAAMSSGILVIYSTSDSGRKRYPCSYADLLIQTTASSYMKVSVSQVPFHCACQRPMSPVEYSSLENIYITDT